MLETEARERVLTVAEQLFARRGYAAVTLRDIATEVGIRHTSLYHHVPGGKEELFVEVTERHLKRHQQGLMQAIQQARPHIKDELHAVADWLLSQAPIDLLRMTQSDMPAIDPRHAEYLSQLALEAMIQPIYVALQEAQQQGEIRQLDFGPIAGGLLGMIESFYAVPETALVQNRQEMAYIVIDALLEGLYPHT
ncbi:TetR family transcriptional regulator [Dictyobacter sp. S3.2.2.5]|uniref:TetR family transcriptional regulator n=1 Tax=Dictyobacter halimunensis TaxID=3026934 RepID=A0ABQ6FJA8_9CHLR|nr:TetR family transcriptional regulator [Dictyobacter sp. S3.2.2.5]